MASQCISSREPHVAEPAGPLSQLNRAVPFVGPSLGLWLGLASLTVSACSAAVQPRQTTPRACAEPVAAPAAAPPATAPVVTAQRPCDKPLVPIVRAQPNEQPGWLIGAVCGTSFLRARDAAPFIADEAYRVLSVREYPRAATGTPPRADATASCPDVPLVTLTPAPQLGEWLAIGGAWPLLEPSLHRGVLALCGYMVGASERICEMATAFAKERVQFGRPIGSFQAIQHYLAQMITEITGADTTALYAAWTLDEGLPAREIVAKAKVLTGDTFKQASSVGSQIFGGIGFDEDMDTTLFLRRGKQYQLSMGHSGYWEDVLAAELLDR